MIGYDVESFLEIDGQPIAAEKFLGGSKNNPEALDDQVVSHPDNVMAEFASRSPFDHQYLRDIISNDIKKLVQRVAPAKVLLISAMDCPSGMLADSTLAEEIGCDPDYRDGRMREPISTPDIGHYRYAGGHIHFDGHKDLPADIAARVCDVLLGAPLVAMGEKQEGRRTVYGLNGLYRPKSYGIEYRTLSNFWAKLLVNNIPVRAAKFQGLVSMTAAVLEKAEYEVVMRVIKNADYAADIINNEARTEGAKLLSSIDKELRGG